MLTLMKKNLKKGDFAILKKSYYQDEKIAFVLELKTLDFKLQIQ